MEIKFEKIPDYADVFTLEEFQDGVKIGAYSNYDGTGYFAYDDVMADVEIEIRDGQILNIPGFTTHIAWFNKQWVEEKKKNPRE